MMLLIKKHKYLFASLFIVFVVFSYYIFFNNSIMLIPADCYEETYKFYIESWNRLREGSLPYWEWSNFLGNNYFGSNTFYFLGTPFFWLSMCLPKVEWIKYSFLYFDILKSWICVILSYVWLNKICHNKLASSLGGLIITFSGYAFVELSNSFLFDPVAFLPLVLYYIECFVQDKNKRLHIILSTALVGVINYYTLYMAIPFLCIYALVRYLTVNEFDWKKTVVYGSQFVGLVLGAVLICAVIIVPSYYALSGNPRVGEPLIQFKRVSFLVYYRFITSFFIPVCDWRNSINYFISTAVDPGISYGGGFGNYSLVISVFCILPSLFINNKKERNSIIALIVTYLFFAMFPSFYILFNRNLETRWMFVMPIILAYCVAIVVSNRDDIDRKAFLGSSVLFIAAVLLFTYVSLSKDLAVLEWERSFLKVNAVVVSAFALSYGLTFVLKNKKLFSVLFFILMFCEIEYCFYSVFYSQNAFNGPMNIETLEVMDKEYKQAADLIKELDDSFYRIDKDNVYSNLGGNDVYLQRYKSFYSYHSIYNYRMSDFITDRFASDVTWKFGVQTGKDILKTMLGSKYWFTYDDSTDIIVPFGYKHLCSTSDGARIYLNEHPISFAYTRKKVISKDDFDSFDTLHQDYLLLDHVVLDKSTVSDTEMITDLNKLCSDVEEIDLDARERSGYYYLIHPESVIYRSYWTRPNWHLYLDDVEYYSDHIKDEFGYVGVYADERCSTLGLRHISDVEVFYDPLDWFNEWYASQEMADPLSVKWNDNSVSGKISVAEDSYLVTSVPYDKGWALKVDGVKSSYERVNEGFVGFEISAGEHLIELSYVPPGLLYGSLISAAALLTCVILYKKKILI